MGGREQLFVDRDPALVMPALMGGKVKLTGDSSKVPACRPPAPQPGQSLLVPDDTEVDVDVVKSLVARIDEITET